MDEESDQPSRKLSRRNSSALGVVAAMALACLGTLVVSYPLWRGQPRSLDVSGFNVARVPSSGMGFGVPTTPFSVRGPAVSLLPPPAPAGGQGSSMGGSLGMIRPPGRLGASENTAANSDNAANSNNEMNSEDQAALRSVAGKWDSGKASQLGSQHGLVTKVIEGLLQHPRVLGLVLNNKTLVRAVMNQSDHQKLCSDSQALQSYITDTRDPSGFMRGFQLLQSSAQYPGATSAILGSELAKTVMQCSSVSQLSHDPNAVMQIATGNPQLISAISNPDLVKALTANPSTGQLFNAFESGLGGH